MTNSSTDWSERAHAAGFYLGLLPLYAALPRLRESRYAKHHFEQAGALFAVFAGLVLLLGITALGLSYLLVNHRDIYQDFRVEYYLMGTLRKIYIAWLVFWAFGLLLALFGSSRPMPLLHRISSRALTWKLASGNLIAAYVLVAVLVPVAFHARALAPIERDHGTVHFLYEDNGIFPRWFFQIAFYPMTRTASSLWGDESVVVQRFDRPAVLRAVQEARFIYLGTHGTKKGLMLKEGWLTPEDINAVGLHPDLQFVYLSGCDSGAQRDGWLAAFAPAEVVTYDRLSAVLEHAWWLWFTGPGQLRELDKDSTG